jgi:hypothetical protein
MKITSDKALREWAEKRMRHVPPALARYWEEAVAALAEATKQLIEEVLDAEVCHDCREVDDEVRRRTVGTNSVYLCPECEDLRDAPSYPNQLIEGFADTRRKPE